MGRYCQNLGNELAVKINADFKCPDTSHDFLVKIAIFYGSVLQNSNSEEYEKLLIPWNVAVKILWGHSHVTHKNFVEPLTNCPQ